MTNNTRHLGDRDVDAALQGCRGARRRIGEGGTRIGSVHWRVQPRMSLTVLGQGSRAWCLLITDGLDCRIPASTCASDAAVAPVGADG